MQATKSLLKDRGGLLTTGNLGIESIIKRNGTLSTVYKKWLLTSKHVLMINVFDSYLFA